MSRRVLIVDDEKKHPPHLQDGAGGRGLRPCRWPRPAKRPWKSCAEQKPDVVVLDVKLPGIDGIETLRRLKEHDRELPVIMISGHGTIATAVEATRHGAFDFVEKPLSKERLLVAIRNALEVRQLGREVQRPARPRPQAPPDGGRVAADAGHPRADRAGGAHRRRAS